MRIQFILDNIQYIFILFNLYYIFVQTKIMIKIKKQKTQFNNCNFLTSDVTVANQPKLFTFQIKDVFSLDVFKVDLVLKIKDN